jgi:hypothetical protein
VRGKNFLANCGELRNLGEGFSNIITNKGKKAAFTLAETLIAIGIIGVVSALTIPTLVKNYQKRVIEVNLKKTYADISRVIRQSEAENGTFDGWDYSLSYANFVAKYITPYMPMYPCNERKKGDYCFDKDGYIWRSGLTGELTTEGIHRVAAKYYTKDGRFWAIYSNYDKPRENHAIMFIVDVNGRTGKSIMSQDVFAFNVTQIRNEKAGIGSAVEGSFLSWKWSDDYVKSLCFSKHHYGEYCGEWIKRNGWKFPKNYPFEVGVKSE